LQLAGKGGQVSWIIGKIIDHPMGMGIEPTQDGCPAGRAKRSGAEMVAEQRSLLRQPVNLWCLQVRVLHTTESISPLVIGEDEDYIWPVRLNQGWAEYNAQKKEGSVKKERNGSFVHFN
jgi:hypothetical protein